MNVLITGANRGIGLEFVRQLASRGDHVIATARNLESADALRALADAHPDRITLTALDATSPEDWCRLAGELDGVALDLAINNAGVLLRNGALGSLDYDAMRTCFEVNVIGALRGLEACLPSLRRGRAKKAITITSKMGSIHDNTSGGAYAYRASKTAVNSVMRSAAMDLRSEGIAVAVLHPGWVQTDMGGPNALITVEQSVAGMLSVIDGLTVEESGTFWEWNGNAVAW
jgi:NAD(P)-dependent dehydrogenase (short-subunit alcohol dehydrogenase family)